jgi:thioesterase domain-containing protein
VNDEEAAASVYEMAAEYVAAIRGIQPEGPYALAGWSLGGVVAHEMAVQLVAAGQTVDLLALVDTFPPGATNVAAPIDVDDVEILAELAREYGLDCEEAELRALDREARIERVLAAARDAQLLPEGAGRREIERVIRTYQANLAALEQHTAGPYSGRVLLCLAEQTTVEVPDARRTALGWRAICGSPPEVRVVRGSHRTMVFEPDVESVGTLLVEELSLLRKVVC